LGELKHLCIQIAQFFLFCVDSGYPDDEGQNENNNFEDDDDADVLVDVVGDSFDGVHYLVGKCLVYFEEIVDVVIDILEHRIGENG
jgi:hypothetical protein